MSIQAEGTTLKFDTHEIACVLGDFAVEKTREVKEKVCATSGTVRKVVGAKKLSDLTIAVPKGEASNSAAEAAIRAAFESGELKAFEIEDSDMPSGGSNGSKIAFNCYVVKDVVKYQAEDELEFEFTVTVSGGYTLTAAA